MVVPLIFITTITLKEGKLEDFKRYSEQMGKFVEENEPRIIHFEQYINEGGTEMTGVQIHPDEDSMAFHMQVAGERMAQAYEFIDAIKSLQIYGEPSDAFVEHMKLSGSAMTAVFISTEPRPGSRNDRTIRPRQ
jgi:secreted PhoX family phosphatase